MTDDPLAILPPNLSNTSTATLIAWLAAIQEALTFRAGTNVKAAVLLTEDVPLKLVLLVDDEKAVTDLLQVILEIGYEIIIARNRRAALKAVEIKTPDIALIDWVLGDESGAPLCYELHRLFPDMPIIILSGYRISLKEAQEVGAVQVIDKPYSPMYLADEIERLLKDE